MTLAQRSLRRPNLNDKLASAWEQLMKKVVGNSPIVSLSCSARLD